MKKIVSVLLAAMCFFSFATTAFARLVGDVNTDGKTNSSDALLILQCAVGSSDDVNEAYADVNGDGIVNSSDALIVLQIAVGNYEGDLEVDDALVTSYKKDVVDPIMSSGVYTLVSEVTAEGKATLATTMVNGKDICVETKAEGITVRVLILNSETYLVMPGMTIIPGTKGVYMKYEQQLNPNTGKQENAEYIGSEYVTVEGEKLVCETYKLDDGTVSQYYFKDGKWVMLSVTKDGETATQKIDEFRAGVDKSYFSLDGYIKISE